MAGCELRGELKYRNGDTKQFIVKAETNIKSILSGVQQLKDEVSVVLSDLVIQEKSENPHSRNGNDVSEGKCMWFRTPKNIQVWIASYFHFFSTGSM